jgi:Zn-dependent protease
MESPGFLIAVALASGGLLVMHLLWQILRLPIAAPRQFRQLRQMPATAALAGPVEAAQAELGALGFACDGWVVVEAVPNEAYPMRVFGCLRHGTEPVLAAIQLRPELRQVEHCPVVFHSLLTDGRLLRTYNHAPCELPPRSPFDERQDARADTLAAQWAFHGASVRERRVQVAPLPPTARLVALALAGDRHLIDWRLHQHQFECDDAGVVRFSPRGALALLLRGLFSLRKRAIVRHAPVSPERQAILFHHWAWTQQQVPRWRVQCALFGLSALVIALLGAALWSAGAALGIFVALIVHEAVRYAAQRAAGRRDVVIRMIPLLGGNTAACEPKPSAVRRAWVDLAGPLAGIAIGGLLYAAKPADASGFGVLTASFLVVNGLSLLPLSPLDGGRVLRAIVPPRHARVVTFVEGAVLSAALLACAHGRALLMTVVVAALLVQVSRRLFLGDVVEKLALQTDVADAPRGYDQIVGIAAALDHSAFGRTPMIRRMPLIRRIHDGLRHVPASRMHTALLVAMHAALLGLALPMAVRLLPAMSSGDVGWQAQGGRAR